jgi:uncharacterized circularly permuted ATP-grasp superfamily protein
VVKPANESGGYGMLIGPRSTAEERRGDDGAIEANPAQLHRATGARALDRADARAAARSSRAILDLAAVHPARRADLGTPGGLTRVALRRGSLVVNSSQGGGSKDTWIVATEWIMSSAR